MQNNSLQQGLAALREGRPAEAERFLESAVAGSTSSASAWLALAFSRVHLEKPEAALVAVDRALALEPRNLRALLFKADHLARLGQGRGAVAFYQAALQVAAGAGSLPADVQSALRRASVACEQASDRYQRHVLEALEAQGYQADAAPRFAESLAIAFGEQSVQLQQPTRYYFPGLPQRSFYERSEFTWVAELEAATAAIRREVLALEQAGGCFQPYLESSADIPALNRSANLNSPDWGACYLWREGEPVADVQQRCPETVRALSRLPLCEVPGQMPSVLFSRLAPETRIEPHHGAVNTRLICHLPLVVPEDRGALRVGNQQRPWREGELLIFDDSMEHEAWNDSQAPRIVLLFDIWRPELNAEERLRVSQLLTAVRAYET